MADETADLLEHFETAMRLIQASCTRAGVPPGGYVVDRVVAMESRIADLQSQLAAANERADGFAATMDERGATVVELSAKLNAEKNNTAKYRKQLYDVTERADGLQKIVDAARETCDGIVAASPKAWELPRTDFWEAFVPWAKNRARTVLEKMAAPVPAQPAVVPEVAFCTGIRELVHSAFMILDDSEDMGDGTFMIDGEIARVWTEEMDQALKSLGVLEHSHINERFGNPPAILSTTDTEVKNGPA